MAASLCPHAKNNPPVEPGGIEHRMGDTVQLWTPHTEASSPRVSLSPARSKHRFHPVRHGMPPLRSCVTEPLDYDLARQSIASLINESVESGGAPHFPSGTKELASQPTNTRVGMFCTTEKAPISNTARNSKKYNLSCSKHFSRKIAAISTPNPPLPCQAFPRKPTRVDAISCH